MGGGTVKVTWSELEVPGLLLSSGAVHDDERGTLRKVLSGQDPRLGSFTGSELYWARSRAGVLRGLHFQLPPHATRKLVYVVHGSIRDFVVDLRRGSPAERRLVEVSLTSGTGGLLVPAGCAHAYEVLEEGTVVCYAQDVPYGDSESYGGILYASAGIVPRSAAPIVQSRDLTFPSLDEFASPFTFD